jgi:Tfp pilus assembly PilM family ATPase
MSAPTRRVGWFSSPPPSAAVEITAARVTAASIGDHGGSHVLTAFASEPLTPGVVEPALNAPNVHDAAALTAALKSVLQKVSRPRRVALVLPDSVAKVSRDVVESYERACDAAGAHAGIIDLASFNQINAVLAGGEVPGDWLLVHIASDYATLAVVRSGMLVFFRNRATMGESERPAPRSSAPSRRST